MDLFFYREPEESKQIEDEEAAPQADFGLPAPEYGAAGGEWTTAQIPDASWTGDAQQPISAAPAAASWNDDIGKFWQDLVSFSFSVALSESDVRC